MNDNIKGYLYVLEFSYPAILEIELTEEDDNLTSDEILTKHGYKEDNCHFMYSERKLTLETIKE